MKIKQTRTISITPEELEKLVLEKLAQDGIIKACDDVNVEFKVSKHREGEDLFCEGYEVLTFEGCTATIEDN